MQPAVASLELALILFAVPTHAGVYAPDLLTGSSNDNEDKTMIVFRVLRPSSRPAPSSGCRDDPTWVDDDGDGCAAYAKAINSGEISQEVACGFVEPTDAAFEGDFEGAGSHCRVTCGTCPAEPQTATMQQEDESCMDDPTWTDEDGDGCDVYAGHIQSGDLSKSVACGFEDGGDVIGSGDPHGAAQHCRATCGTCARNQAHPSRSSNPVLQKVAEQIVAESREFDPAMLDVDKAMPFEEEQVCTDDPNWVDMDGDGCAVYAKAIAEGRITQAKACGRASQSRLLTYISSGNPLDAAKYCPVTCGNCHLEALEDNDSDMKDMIRLLVEQESENILQSVNLQEAAAEDEDVPEVTTTTTTAAKKLPQAEVPVNSTWIEYWDPEAEEDKEELSHMDLLEMAANIRPQQTQKVALAEQGRLSDFGFAMSSLKVDL